MEQLAASGGVTKPILYRHFGDRDGLVRAIGEQYATLLVGRIAATLRGSTPEEMLWRTIDSYLEFLESDPELYAFLMRQPAGGAGIDEVNGLIDTIGRQVAVVVGDQLRAEGLDAGGAEPFGFGIVGMVHQAGDWWLRSRSMSRSALTTYLAELLWKGFEGLASPAPAAPPAASDT